MLDNIELKNSFLAPSGAQGVTTFAPSVQTYLGLELSIFIILAVRSLLGLPQVSLSSFSLTLLSRTDGA